MAFTCPFPEKDGRVKVANTRSAFRRHLTVHHGMDYERKADGNDEIVTLSPTQLTARLAVIRRGQRHRSKSTPSKDNVVVPPEDPQAIRHVSSIRGVLSPPLCYRAPSPPEVNEEAAIIAEYATSHDLGLEQDWSIDWSEYGNWQVSLESDCFAEVAMDTGLSPVGPVVTPHSNADTATSTSGTHSTSLSAWLESRGLSTRPSTLPARPISPI